MGNTQNDNDYLKFYKENNISPVNQDISDAELHYKRRQKLYRQLGIPTFAFDGAEMLEVGPGGGHNALAPIHWGICHLDLVEPNHVGVAKIRKLFEEKQIEEARYSIYEERIEEFESTREYDVVIAEGFLGYVPNAAEICKKLGSLCRRGGVISITCSDDICIFPELMKRIAGWAMTSGIEKLDDKVKALIPVIKPQLDSLRGVSRPAKDWIEDNIFNPAFSNGYSFSMRDALEVFEGFDLLGASPSLFTDYSWYKDVWFDEKAEYLDQFNRKRMSLVMAGLNEQTPPEDHNEKLVWLFKTIKKLENDYEKTLDRTKITELYDLMSANEIAVECMDESFRKVFHESIDMIGDLEKGSTPDFGKYPALFKAFGRGLQYMSFMKKG